LSSLLLFEFRQRRADQFTIGRLHIICSLITDGIIACIRHEGVRIPGFQTDPPLNLKKGNHSRRRQERGADLQAAELLAMPKRGLVFRDPVSYALVGFQSVFIDITKNARVQQRTFS
jgi:hypothetical protein